MPADHRKLTRKTYTHQTRPKPHDFGVDTTNQSAVNKLLSQQEKLTAYNTEKGAWASSKAFVPACMSEVTPKANVIGSHVIYICKPDGRPKARIVPWGNRNTYKDDFRGDTHPSISTFCVFSDPWRLKKEGELRKWMPNQHISKLRALVGTYMSSHRARRMTVEEYGNF